MITRAIILLAVTAMLTIPACLRAECCPPNSCEAKTQPATRKSAESVKPGPAVAPAARAILNRLEKAGEKYTTLRTDVEYRLEDRMTGDEEFRTGWAAYQKKTDKQPGKFRVSFERLALGIGRPRKSKQDYIFDGQWLTIAKHRIKSITKLQIAAEGEAVDALKLGKGPFPIPFGQRAVDVIRYLEPTTRKPDKKDPKNTSYLRFVPRRGQEKDVNFVRLEMWVDNKTNLPVKIRTKDAGKKNTTVTFKNIKTQTTIDPKLFTMKKPPGWDLTVERLK